MLPLYSIEFFLMLCCAIGYYKAAEVENVSGFLWAGMSAGIFFITWRVFHWGIFGDLVGQAALLAGITIFRVLRDMKSDPPEPLDGEKKDGNE
jgi:hypothetical protein